MRMTKSDRNEKGESREETGALSRFFKRQMQLWPEASRRYEQLVDVQTHEVTVGTTTFEVQFNPARIQSTGATITKEALAERPCFLCRKNRPMQQMRKVQDEYNKELKTILTEEQYQAYEKDEQARRQRFGGQRGQRPPMQRQ